MTEVQKEFIKLFKDMAQHLDYCGYGDSWERECADERKLPERVDKMLEKIEKLEQGSTKRRVLK